jgi:hypothetical protein
MATDLGLIAKALAAAGVNPDRMVIIASPAQALGVATASLAKFHKHDHRYVGIDRQDRRRRRSGRDRDRLRRHTIGRSCAGSWCDWARSRLVTPAESWFRRGPDLGMVLDLRSGHLHSGRRINPLQSLIFLWGRGGIEKNFLLFHFSGAAAADLC